jgi:hypothetical protein
MAAPLADDVPFCTNKPLEQFYNTLGVIGEGAYGVVRKAERLNAAQGAAK